MNDLTFEKLPQAVTQIYDKLEKIERLLEAQHNVDRIDSDKLLTIREAAEIIHLSVPTIYGLVQRQEIPVCKKGKRLYFTQKELTHWIKSGRKKTVEEIQSEASQYMIRKGLKYGK
ncbi:MAG: helix-turn-helix domain-containing protein [Bacteroidales bacterium]|nr:helix-turn-helix domain-containing protein [Bacteroidales bacterium]